MRKLVWQGMVLWVEINIAQSHAAFDFETNLRGGYTKGRDDIEKIKGSQGLAKRLAEQCRKNKYLVEV